MNHSFFYKVSSVNYSASLVIYCIGMNESQRNYVIHVRCHHHSSEIMEIQSKKGFSVLITTCISSYQWKGCVFFL